MDVAEPSICQKPLCFASYPCVLVLCFQDRADGWLGIQAGRALRSYDQEPDRQISNDRTKFDSKKPPGQTTAGKPARHYLSNYVSTTKYAITSFVALSISALAAALPEPAILHPPKPLPLPFTYLDPVLCDGPCRRKKCV